MYVSARVYKVDLETDVLHTIDAKFEIYRSVGGRKYMFEIRYNKKTFRQTIVVPPGTVLDENNFAQYLEDMISGGLGRSGKSYTFPDGSSIKLARNLGIVAFHVRWNNDILFVITDTPAVRANRYRVLEKNFFFGVKFDVKIDHFYSYIDIDGLTIIPRYRGSESEIVMEMAPYRVPFTTPMCDSEIYRLGCSEQKDWSPYDLVAHIDPQDPDPSHLRCEAKGQMMTLRAQDNSFRVLITKGTQDELISRVMKQITHSGLSDNQKLDLLLELSREIDKSIVDGENRDPSRFVSTLVYINDVTVKAYELAGLT